MGRSWLPTDNEESREMIFQTAALIPTSTEHVVVEEEEEYYAGGEVTMDPSLLARIEALEQERQFAEQWASHSFAPVDATTRTPQAPVAPRVEEASEVPEQAFNFEFESADVTPAVPIAALTMPHVAEEPAATPIGSTVESPIVQRLKRADTFQSVSEMSEAESVITLRDSLVSADTPTERKPAGSSINFIY
ncbi:hypothetical protein UCDDA912_g05073 [Diaporthe ampelina]|uniref:Uncharacterized protein n=1 Tax=Diaporthe ampelina TaxID=1214573 RepID=A0A0G2FLK0_9PEZI|nr:hypothetical protein UCDDA912_g05073 [Diaporthe ampelina]